jgi:NitT/TauT family transport system substrate-binding protein
MFHALRRRLSQLRVAWGLAIATLLLIVACTGVTGSGAKPMTVGAMPWFGYAGHFIGLEKGLFKAAKLDVQDRSFPNSQDERTAFLDQKLDLAWFPTEDAIQIAAKDPTVKVIYTADYSNGRDGIVAWNVRGPNDLQGKTIAREDSIAAKVMLRRFLGQGNINENNVKIKVMPADKAASEFANQKIDAAVTVEPQLSQAAKKGDGELIFTTEDTNLIAHALLVQGDLLKNRKPEVQAYLKAIDQGVALLLKDDPEALKIVAKKLGLAAADVKAQKKWVRVFDGKGNKEVALDARNPRNISANLELMAQGALEFKVTDKLVETKDLVDDSLVKAL